MNAKCNDCDGTIIVPDDAVEGEIVTCPDCGLNFEVAQNTGVGVMLKPAENVGEDWGE
jgi:alpha-aminoadipate carrier protein LysW